MDSVVKVTSSYHFTYFCFILFINDMSLQGYFSYRKEGWDVWDVATRGSHKLHMAALIITNLASDRASRQSVRAEVWWNLGCSWALFGGATDSGTVQSLSLCLATSHPDLSRRTFKNWKMMQTRCVVFISTVFFHTVCRQSVCLSWLRVSCVDSGLLHVAKLGLASVGRHRRGCRGREDVRVWPKRTKTKLLGAL